MKNKKNLYILIPAVVFIWGFVIFKIIDFTKDENIHYQRSTDYNIETNKNDSISKKYELDLSYRDPFLSGIKQARTNSIGANIPMRPIISNKSEIVEATPPAIVQNIQYLGVIEQPGKLKVGLIKINGITQMLKEDDQYEEILVKKIYSDSIHVKIQGENYYFNINL